MKFETRLRSLLAESLLAEAIPPIYVWRPTSEPKLSLNKVQLATLAGLGEIIIKDLHNIMEEFPNLKNNIYEAQTLYNKNIGIYVDSKLAMHDVREDRNYKTASESEKNINDALKQIAEIAPELKPGINGFRSYLNNNVFHIFKPFRRLRH